jgi:hypothetical protein
LSFIRIFKQSLFDCRFADKELEKFVPLTPSKRRKKKSHFVLSTIERLRRKREEQPVKNDGNLNSSVNAKMDYFAVFHFIASLPRPVNRLIDGLEGFALSRSISFLFATNSSHSW